MKNLISFSFMLFVSLSFSSISFAQTSSSTSECGSKEKAELCKKVCSEKGAVRAASLSSVNVKPEASQCSTTCDPKDCPAICQLLCPALCQNSNKTANTKVNFVQKASMSEKSSTSCSTTQTKVASAVKERNVEPAKKCCSSKEKVSQL